MVKNKAENKVFTYLLNGIQTKDFPPSVQIREEKVASALQVSRSPVRAALKKLADLGYVDLIPNRGAYVKEATLSSKDFTERLSMIELLLTHYFFELEKWEQAPNRTEWEKLKASAEVIQNKEEKQEYLENVIVLLLNKKEDKFFVSIVWSCFQELTRIDFNKKEIDLSYVVSTCVDTLTVIIENLLAKKYPLARKELRLFVNDLSLKAIDKQEILQNKYE